MLAADARGQTLYPSVALQRHALASEVWPGDFNGDGITDLAATAQNQAGLVVVPGRGDGTFGAGVTMNVVGRVIQVADFNGDRRPDLIVEREFDDPGVFILAGAGALRFGAPQRIATFGSFFALTGDFNRDGRRDLLLGTGSGFHIFPGNGDLTFGPSVAYASDLLLNGGIAADFDEDGDLDVVIAEETGSVHVYENEGALLFTLATTIPFATMPTDATAGDLDRDGNIDLIVSTTAFGDFFSYGQGRVHVLRGRGDGTFAAPVSYDVGRGAFQVVVGDFTHDGWLDIATGNRSFTRFEGNCGPSLMGSDSVTVLSSTGAGRFGVSATFALRDQSVADTSGRYQDTIRSLNTSDLDRDRFPDLIVSEGVVLLSRLPRTNRPPVANAGADTRQINDSFVQLIALGRDPDEHLLEFTWEGSDGLRTSLPWFCYDVSAPGTYTYRLTADDGLGGTDDDTKVVVYESTQIPPTIELIRPTDGEVVPAGVPYRIRWTADDDFGIARIAVRASLDGRSLFLIPECVELAPTATECTWRNPPPSENVIVEVRVTDTHGNESVDSAAFFIRGTPPAGSLPAGWTNRDIGAVGAAGSASFSGGRFTVRGSGADVWGTADEFHYVYRAQPFVQFSNFSITARVDSVQNLHRWVKAGLMIRESTAPGARHVSVFATPRTERGIAFQRRTTTGGESTHTAGPAIAPPLWLKLTKVGNTFRAFSRRTLTDPWALVGEQVMTNLPETMLIGLAVSSHIDGRVAAATFSEVEVEFLPTWSSVHVGTSQGTSTWDNTRFTVEGSGSIGGTADSFALVGPNFFGSDQTLTARVLSIENTNAQAKAGLMVRHTLDRGSPFVMVYVTAAGRVGMQWRTTPNAAVATSTLRTAAAPLWLRLERFFNEYRGYFSTDGVTFTQVGSVEVIGDVSYNGLVVASHSTSRATGRFDDVKLVVR